MTNSLRLYHNVHHWITQHLPVLRKPTRATLGWLMTGLCLSRHVHLSKIASHRPGRVTLCSRIRQLRRWLANSAVEVRSLYAAVTRRLVRRAAEQGRLRLLIDVLELSGRRQILMLALAYRRRAIPLLWQVRRGKGVTDAKTQIALVRALLPQIPGDAEVVVIGDGEFHAVAFMQWIREQGWHFCVRLHADTRVQLAEGAWMRLDAVEIAPGECRTRVGVHVTERHAYGPVNLLLCWARGEEEPWRLATSLPPEARIGQLYSRRMWIEELFGDLQGGGFRLEQSRLYAAERLDRLLLALALVYVWLLHVGSYVIKRGWRRRVDRNDRRDRSLVEIGRYWIQHCLCNGHPPPVALQPYFS